MILGVITWFKIMRGLFSNNSWLVSYESDNVDRSVESYILMHDYLWRAIFFKCPARVRQS